MNDSKRPVDFILSELGDSMGMKDLAFDENGGCILQFDESMNVLLLYEGGDDVLYLFSFVGELAKDSEKKTMRLLLEANYRWEESGGGTLSLRKGENNIVLTHKLAVAALTKEILEQYLSDFVTALEKWMNFLKDPSSSPIKSDEQNESEQNNVSKQPPASMIRA